MPVNATHPIHTEKTQQVDYMRGVQHWSFHLDFNDVSGAARTITGPRLPPAGASIIDVVINKKVDFNGGTSTTLDIGINYEGSTTDDPNGIVAAHDLRSATALGILRATMADLAIAHVDEPAHLVAVLNNSGAITTGEAFVTVVWVPNESIEEIDAVA